MMGGSHRRGRAERKGHVWLNAPIEEKRKANGSRERAGRGAWVARTGMPSNQRNLGLKRTLFAKSNEKKKLGLLYLQRKGKGEAGFAKKTGQPYHQKCKTCSHRQTIGAGWARSALDKGCPKGSKFPVSAEKRKVYGDHKDAAREAIGEEFPSCGFREFQDSGRKKEKQLSERINKQRKRMGSTQASELKSKKPGTVSSLGGKTPSKRGGGDWKKKSSTSKGKTDLNQRNLFGDRIISAKRGSNDVRSGKKPRVWGVLKGSKHLSWTAIPRQYSHRTSGASDLADFGFKRSGRETASRGC